MRLDLILFHSGLFDKRIVAKRYCIMGHVLVNGVKKKPTADVAPGDIISVVFKEKTIEFTFHIEEKDNVKTVYYDLIENNYDA